MNVKPRVYKWPVVLATEKNRLLEEEKLKKRKRLKAIKASFIKVQKPFLFLYR